ncbi:MULTISPECIES: NfeD family protein [unclassified Paenibacillus]|uniref:NfeD family protein n=1 Tax=unclassified Paenibacillus TaxID=185978 RepID=UPI001AE3FBE0|nr:MULTISPECIES: NfeD family protein [unclassified Paenibacillus]MBP1156334.1 membrane-bound serine protease (ClpP class) [Paenibacillus sp. PvP091]MBP1168280.1 membrane-bound serine protease (ClpP class) [Paenibacillus sp. PvR098]MBP2439308.1 membrane-bound serine protease (ClpP class) [Paenibacillus sp. PvP052]
MRVQTGGWKTYFLKKCIMFMLAMTLILSAILIGLPDMKTAHAETKPLAAPVVVIPVHQTVETGLYNFLERAFREAEEMNALHIVLDINTFGGRVDSAQEIGQLIKNSPIPTIAYVRGKAISAGSYIALNAEQIAMEPGSSIGAAAVVDITGNEIENVKVISTWSGLMKGAAEMRGRNSQIAEAMVDKNVGVTMPEIGRTVPKGEIVTLTSQEALKVGYAETVAASLEDVVKFVGGENHPLMMMELSVAEKIARFVTQPWVTTLLLLIGIAGVAIEIIVPGFGLPGILGLLGFGLYFFGHYIAGFAGMEDIALFVAGIILLFLEIFVSSFGILGVLGALCLFSGVVLSAYNKEMAVWSLGIAFVSAAVIVAIVIRIFRHRGVWNRFILSEKLTTEQGYVSASSRKELLGQTALALTPLRPAGTAAFGEERVDVVTSGEFVAAGRPVTVVQVEGSRIVVKELKEV